MRPAPWSSAATGRRPCPRPRRRRARDRPPAPGRRPGSAHPRAAAPSRARAARRATCRTSSRRPTSSAPSPSGRMRACTRDTLGSASRTVLSGERPIVCSSTSAIRRRSGRTSSSTPRFDHGRPGAPSGNRDRAARRTRIRSAPPAGSINVTTRTSATASRSRVSLWRTPRTRALLIVATLAGDPRRRLAGRPRLHRPAVVRRGRPGARLLDDAGVEGAAAGGLRARDRRASCWPTSRCSSGASRRRPIHALGAIAGGLLSLQLQPGDLWQPARPVGAPQRLRRARPAVRPRRRLLRLLAAAAAGARPLAARARADGRGADGRRLRAPAPAARRAPAPARARGRRALR